MMLNFVLRPQPPHHLVRDRWSEPRPGTLRSILLQPQSHQRTHARLFLPKLGAYAACPRHICDTTNRHSCWQALYVAIIVGCSPESIRSSYQTLCYRASKFLRVVADDISSWWNEVLMSCDSVAGRTWVRRTFPDFLNILASDCKSFVLNCYARFSYI